MHFIKRRLNTMGPHERNGFFFTYEGAVGAIVLNLVNPFVSMFAKRMGANDFHIGLISSMPALVGILALIPGAMLVDRQRDKKGIVALHMLLVGLLYPLAALTPYMGSIRVVVFILIIALVNWPLSVYNASWQSFFSDVLPPGRRNLAYTSRTRAATFFGVITSMIGGLILSYVPRSEGERIIIYQIYYLAAFALVLVQAWLLYQVKGYTLPDSDDSTLSMASVVKSFKLLIGNKPFMQYALVVFVFHVAWQMAWPLFFIYQVDYLNANEAWLSYITVANGLATVVTFSFWRKVMEKKGASWTVMMGATGLALNPILIILTRSLFVALLINIVLGLTFAAYQLSLFEGLLEVVPQKGKTLNIAIYTVMINISGFLSPIVGVWIYKATSIYFAMALDGLLRFVAVGLFYWRYKKPATPSGT